MAHSDYLQVTDHRTTCFKMLSKKDEEVNNDIRAKRRAIERLEASNTSLRAKAWKLEREGKSKIRLLAEEKDSIRQECTALKIKMKKFDEEQKSRVTELTMNATSAKEFLDGSIKLSERILATAEMGRRYESEAEQSTAFGRIGDAATRLSGISFEAQPHPLDHIMTKFSKVQSCVFDGLPPSFFDGLCPPSSIGDTGQSGH